MFMFTKIDKWFCNTISRIETHIRRVTDWDLENHFGSCGKNSIVRNPYYCVVPQKIYLGDNVNINDGMTFIARPDCEAGKLIIKDNCIITQHFTAITNNHSVVKEIGKPMKEVFQSRKNDKDEDIVIEEDVWVACNVTILPGVVVGRGSIIGAGAVVRHTVPPYAIVLGNPGTVIGFRFTPEQIIEHESLLYSEEVRIPHNILLKNYNEFLDKKLH